MNYLIPDLFALGDLETKSVFKACSHAHRTLGELKGVVHTMAQPQYFVGYFAFAGGKRKFGN